jgi:hypothetical protein
MKKLILTSAMLVASVAAFAQGKINLINDSASLVMLSSSGNVSNSDISLRGQPVGNSSPLLSGVVLTAGLFGGTSSSQLYLYSTTALTGAAAGSAGIIGPMHVICQANPTTGALNIPGIANNTPIGSTTPWFDVKVWDNAYASYDAAFAAGAYTGASPLFQMNPGPSLGYVNTAPPSLNSTWTEGPIFVALGGTIPEPSSVAFAGLAAAAMLIFRRRK